MGLQSIYLELKGFVKIKKGKELTFPKNVDKDYGIWKDYTLKDFGYMALIEGLDLLFIILSPYNLILILTKTATVVLTMTIVMAILAIKPVSARKNIKVRSYLKTRSQYARNQKLHFSKPQKRGDTESELEKTTTK